MNGIPTTFSEHQIVRTILGGRENQDPQCLDIAVILLNESGSHFKLHIFENLLQCNFKQIISVQHSASNFTDDISKKFTTIKFIVPQEKTNDGDLINLAMSEVTATYVLVIRDSLYISSSMILPHLAERITKDNIFCVAPRLLDNKKNSIPCVFNPSAENNRFVVEASAAITDGMKTLYPFDNIAIYNRQKFIELGGFDWTINSPYWQNLDLGLRAWLWGEEIRLTSLLQFSYVEEPPIEDRSSNLDYLRYYLKNELPKIKMEQGYIKNSSFIIFLNRSSCGFLEARRQFKEARNWVEKNKFRYKMDLQTFVQNWNR